MKVIQGVKTRFCRVSMVLLLLHPLVAGATAGGADSIPGRFISFRSGNSGFFWNAQEDRARVVLLPEGRVIWQGSLLPSFWVEAGHRKEFISCTLSGVKGDTGNIELSLRVGRFGRGKLTVRKEEAWLRFAALEIEWTGAPPAIIEMYFGVSDKALKNSPVLPTWDRPFIPDWQSAGFCVPGAKEGPAQSYFRMWDFGLTNIALGSYGPSMGSPYGAAYPKPLYFAGMGSNDGFVALGAGSIPDGAMSLRVQATRGCFQYVYNEEIWGALPGRRRSWTEPLRICLGGTALEAFANYYRTFPAKRKATVPVSFFNTWGLWREKKYTIAPIGDFARRLGSSMLVLDDGWESSQGSGTLNGGRFPHVDADLAALQDSGMSRGVWETLGWIDDTTAAGLGSADLIVDRHGHPCKANWNFDPASPSYYCLDMSSARSREFLRQRTLGTMRRLKPALLKLDFGYGFPSPLMGVPRDPQYRGERQYAAMVRLIAETAKKADPSVRVLYYGISPLCLDDIDIVSLDDQGDLWYDVAGGHGEWSIWASLLSQRNVSVSGSSGYNWETDEEVILNTAVIGSPGASLPIASAGGKPIEAQYLNRRLAINTWFRKTVLWEPLWLNSSTGDLDGPPRLRCWGRVEKAGNGDVLTSLVLRDSAGLKGVLRYAGIDAVALGATRWKGRWAILAQDNEDIYSGGRLALIPFDKGEITIPYAARPARVTRLNMNGAAAYEDWEWKDGMLTVRVAAGVVEETAGFEVLK